MEILLLGIGIGLVTLIPPGPVTLALVQISSRRGPHYALWGAAGVASGDFVLAWISLGIVAAGTQLPASLFAAIQLLSAVLLAGIGMLLLLRPGVVAASVDRIERPGRALFLLTSLTPTALGAWVALLASMPFADEPGHLAVFAIGVVIASVLWHPTLGTAASVMGGRLGLRGEIRLARAGGIAMVVLAAALAVHQLGP